MDIFISHSDSQADSQRSKAVCEALRREGYSVAIDNDFLLLGDEFRSQIKKELDEAKVVVVLWSHAAVASRFVRDEASRATGRKVLLQLIIDDLGDTDVPLGFGELEWLRCEWTHDHELAAESLHEVVEALKRHLPGVEPLDAAVTALQGEVAEQVRAEYEVLERVGTGRMSVVFKAHHAVNGLVALKVTPLAGILLLPGFYAEFMDTVEAARRLSHPNVLRVRDVKLFKTVACRVIDFVKGGSLAHFMAKAGPRVPLGRIKDIAVGIVSALAHAHQNGVVHCSLSPSDVLVADGDDRVYVSDFGMPNVGGGPEAAAIRALFMDARYLSPEQCHGEPATPQSDQYAFGAILYEMLTGRSPFLGKSSFAIMTKHCNDAPVPIVALRPECPAQVALSVMRMLAKDPKERYLTTSMLAREIGTWPIAESVRGSAIPMSAEPCSAAKVALESYNRCLATPDFLATFYQRILVDESLARHLANMNFDRQVGMLKRSVRHLLEYAQGYESARTELERVATSHQRLGIDGSHLRRFVNALIELALERDPRAANPGDRERLKAEWHAATEPGISRFLEIVRAAPRPTELVVTGAVARAP